MGKKKKIRYRIVTKDNHMCMSIEGCLRNHKRKKILIFSDDNGKQISDQEARKFLNDCLIEGKRVIPIGECYRFDFQKGCLGHIKAIMPNKEKMEQIEVEFKKQKST